MIDFDKKDFNNKLDFMDKLIIFFVIISLIITFAINSFLPNVTRDDIKNVLKIVGKKLLKWFLVALWIGILIGIPIYFTNINEALPEIYVIFCLFSLLCLAIFLLTWNEIKTNSYYDIYNTDNKPTTNNYIPSSYREKQRNGELTDKQLIIRKKQIRDKLKTDKKLTKKEEIFNKLNIKT